MRTSQAGDRGTKEWGCEWSLLSEEAEPAGSKDRSRSDINQFTQTLAGLLPARLPLQWGEINS